MGKLSDRIFEEWANVSWSLVILGPLLMSMQLVAKFLGMSVHPGIETLGFVVFVTAILSFVTIFLVILVSEVLKVLALMIRGMNDEL
jgi:hypothetical protein